MKYRLEDLDPMEFASESSQKRSGVPQRVSSSFVLGLGATIGVFDFWRLIDEPDPVVTVIAQLFFASMLFALLYFSALITASRVQGIPLKFLGRSGKRSSTGRWLVILRLFAMLPLALALAGYAAWYAFSGQTVGESWLRTEIVATIAGTVAVAEIFLINSWTIANSAPMALQVKNLRWRVMVLLASGPVVCFLVAAGCLCASILAAKGGPAWLVRQLIINVVILAGMVIEISGSTSGEESDWKTLSALWRPGAAADRVAAQWVLRYSEVPHCLPQDEDIIRMAVGEEDGSREHFNGIRVRYAWLMDCARTEEAEKTLVWLLVHSAPGRIRSLICMEAAFFCAYFERNVIFAQMWLTAAGESLDRDRCTELSARAAVALAEGKWAECREMANAACRAAAKFPFISAARLAIERASNLLSEAEAGMGPL